MKARHEHAILQGYDTHAEYMLAQKMAATPDTVRDFLDEIASRFDPIMANEKEFM